ncbi:hypothetical protein HDE_03618 [Halotydeus destructor]|nr:hypothetical protein HDE_03618 [Halotydeus destructor]
MNVWRVSAATLSFVLFGTCLTTSVGERYQLSDYMGYKLRLASAKLSRVGQPIDDEPAYTALSSVFQLNRNRYLYNWSYEFHFVRPTNETKDVANIDDMITVLQNNRSDVLYRMIIQEFFDTDAISYGAILGGSDLVTIQVLQQSANSSIDFTASLGYMTFLATRQLSIGFIVAVVFLVCSQTVNRLGKVQLKAVFTILFNYVGKCFKTLVRQSYSEYASWSERIAWTSVAIALFVAIFGFALNELSTDAVVVAQPRYAETVGDLLSNSQAYDLHMIQGLYFLTRLSLERPSTELGRIYHRLVSGQSCPQPRTCPLGKFVDKGEYFIESVKTRDCRFVLLIDKATAVWAQRCLFATFDPEISENVYLTQKPLSKAIGVIPFRRNLPWAMHSYEFYFVESPPEHEDDLVSVTDTTEVLERNTSDVLYKMIIQEYFDSEIISHGPVVMALDLVIVQAVQKSENRSVDFSASLGYVTVLATRQLSFGLIVTVIFLSCSQAVHELGNDKVKPILKVLLDYCANCFKTVLLQDVSRYRIWSQRVAWISVAISLFIAIYGFTLNVLSTEAVVVAPPTYAETAEDLLDHLTDYDLHMTHGLYFIARLSIEPRSTELGRIYFHMKNDQKCPAPRTCSLGSIVGKKEYFAESLEHRDRRLALLIDRATASWAQRCLIPIFDREMSERIYLSRLPIAQTMGVIAFRPGLHWVIRGYVSLKLSFILESGLSDRFTEDFLSTIIKNQLQGVEEDSWNCLNRPRDKNEHVVGSVTVDKLKSAVVGFCLVIAMSFITLIGEMALKIRRSSGPDMVFTLTSYNIRKRAPRVIYISGSANLGFRKNENKQPFLENCESSLRRAIRIAVLLALDSLL